MQWPSVNKTKPPTAWITESCFIGVEFEYVNVNWFLCCEGK